MTLPESLSGIREFVEGILKYEIFRLNDTPITLMSLIMFLIVLFVFYLVSRLIVRGILSKILTKFQIDEGTQYPMRGISHYILMSIGALVAFQFVGIDLSGLAVIFGLLSVGIGFGLQNVTSNFVAGLILLFERPITVGDRVTVGDTDGDVESIKMRATVIRSRNNISIIVPNSEFIGSNVINWSHGDPKIRLDIDVGVSYSSDLDQVLRALREVAEEVPQVMKQPEPRVLFVSFGDSSWNLQLRAWIPSPKDHRFIRSEINCAIIRKFAEYDIEIPFPQRDLHLRSPLPLPHQSSASEN